ncbi:phage tail protein [Methylobacterium gossipiicola]|uniref:Microcystin-dependent protein n=1 Tax=Methylobacterium gossipiicola TaxID=582675 RepID=A0A1I2VCF4_9HYPH|nr:tail fiber protein [Methylobacterium gossipiicola]SFG86912.1 Microcystin-dependent protein [Methylobacterium gossipiicola]
MDPMLGMIYLVPYNWAPRDYLICQGQKVNVNQYQALFSLISNLYGGDAVLNFGLPNLQGRAPIGFGTASSGTNYLLGSVTGTEKNTLSTANLPAHNHGATFEAKTGQQSVTIPAVTGNLQVGVTVNATTAVATSGSPTASANMLSSGGVTKIYGQTQTSNLVALSGTSATVTGNPSIPANTVTINTVTGGAVTVSPTGNGAPVSNMQPSLALNFIIAVNGIYPDRP